MKTHEDKTNALPCCQVDDVACHDCKYFGKPFCASIALKDALARIAQLETTIDLMIAKMHGDCGVCKHRHEQKSIFRAAIAKGEFIMAKRCADCLTSEGRPLWEFEGLPGQPKKGASL